MKVLVVLIAVIAATAFKTVNCHPTVNRVKRQSSSSSSASASSSSSSGGGNYDRTNEFGIGAAAGIGGFGSSAGLGSFNADTKSNAFLPFGAFAGINLPGSGRIGAGCSGFGCGFQFGDYVAQFPSFGQNFNNGYNGPSGGGFYQDQQGSSKDPAPPAPLATSANKSDTSSTIPNSGTNAIDIRITNTNNTFPNSNNVTSNVELPIHAEKKDPGLSLQSQQSLSSAILENPSYSFSSSSSSSSSASSSSPSSTSSGSGQQSSNQYNSNTNHVHGLLKNIGHAVQSFGGVLASLFQGAANGAKVHLATTLPSSLESRPLSPFQTFFPSSSNSGGSSSQNNNANSMSTTTTSTTTTSTTSSNILKNTEQTQVDKKNEPATDLQPPSPAIDPASIRSGTTATSTTTHSTAPVLSSSLDTTSMQEVNVEAAASTTTEINIKNVKQSSDFDSEAPAAAADIFPAPDASLNVVDTQT